MKMKNVLLLLGFVFLISCGAPTKKYDYVIKETDSTEKNITIRINIPGKYSKDTLIDIARLERSKRNWDKKFVVFFYEDNYSNNTSWATVSYLLNCKNCNEKDRENNNVLFDQKGSGTEEVKTKSIVLPDLKEGEVSLAKYKDEEKGAFCELIERNNNEVVRIIAFPDGSFSEDYYDKRRIDNKEVFFYNKKNKGYDDEFYSYFFIEDEYLVLRLKGMSDKKYKLE